jgi:FkbM family methyltransferase
LRVQHNAERLGKALELDQLHHLLVARRDPELLMVVCNADTTVDPSAFLHLLEPFFEDPQMAVAWGVALPYGPTKRRRASRFQARLAVAVAQGLGPDAIRADGRLFAVRPRMLDGFSWRAGLIVDDMQLAGYVRSTGLPHRSACRAVTYTVPARGWRDFYLQTHRYYVAKSRLSASGTDQLSSTASNGVTARLRDRSFPVLVNAFCREATADPAGAIAYGVARCACVAIHRFSPAEFSDAWPEARSTKAWPRAELPSAPAIGGSSPVPPAARIAVEKIALGLKVVRTCRNWPGVLGAWLANRMPVVRLVAPRDLELRLRTGGMLRAPNSVLGTWPLLEVLVGDAYHLDRLPWSTSTEPPLTVLDIGAHVGSFTIALAERYPAAKMTCYEPSPTSAAFLRANITANHLDQRVQVLQSAVASEPGSVRLYSEGDASCEATTISPAVGSDAATQTVTVCPAVAFETAVSTAGKPDLVKLDCEGAEYDIVLNSKRPCWEQVSSVLLEYHPVVGHSWEELRRHFGELGFAVSWVNADQRRPGLGTAMLVRGEPEAPR